MTEFSDRSARLAEFRALRNASGPGAFSEAGSARALKTTRHAVWLRCGGARVGMGRLLGDGGCLAQVNDIAVHPRLRAQGHGTRIMAALMRRAEDNLPPDCCIGPIADPWAEALCRKFGFEARNGMARTAR